MAILYPIIRVSYYASQSMSHITQPKKGITIYYEFYLH